MKFTTRSLAVLGLSATTAFSGAALIAPAVAGADALAATSVAVASPNSGPTTGHRLRFTAQVTSEAAGNLHGTMTWSITDRFGTSYTCERVSPVNSIGKASCEFGPGQLNGASAPYAVTASYQGNTMFSASTSPVFQQGVTPANTQMRIAVSGVADGAPATITATLHAPNAVNLLNGQVTFSVTSTHFTTRATCTNITTSTNPNRNLSVPVTGTTVTCDLPAGWLVLPSAGSAKHPVVAWSVTASYSDSSAGASFGTISRVLNGRLRG